MMLLYLSSAAVLVDSARRGVDHEEVKVLVTSLHCSTFFFLLFFFKAQTGYLFLKWEAGSGIV